MQPNMSPEEIRSFLAEVFPQLGSEFRIDAVSADEVVMRLCVDEAHLRPGGTVSGPSMFALADVTAYVATLAHIGPEALAVTTHCSIDFMRKPGSDQDLIARGQVLKMGKSLAVISVGLVSEGQQALVAQANLTYAIPPKRAAQ